MDKLLIFFKQSEHFCHPEKSYDFVNFGKSGESQQRVEVSLRLNDYVIDWQYTKYIKNKPRLYVVQSYLLAVEHFDIACDRFFCVASKKCKNDIRKK